MAVDFSVIARSVSDEAIHDLPRRQWIASRSLSSGARSRDPLARNDEKLQQLPQGRDNHHHAAGDHRRRRGSPVWICTGMRSTKGSGEKRPGQRDGADQKGEGEHLRG